MDDGRGWAEVRPLVQRLEFAPQSFDAVVSHHAFYLMLPVEAVLAEIARVLSPGGWFAFATVDPLHEDHPLHRALMEQFGPLTARDNPAFAGWGDKRVWSLEGLHELFVSTGQFTGPRLTTRLFGLRETPDAACRRLMEFYYSVQLQTPTTRAQLRERWLETLRGECDAEGLVRTPFPGAVVEFRRLAT